MDWRNRSDPSGCRDGWRREEDEGADEEEDEIEWYGCEWRWQEQIPLLMEAKQSVKLQERRKQMQARTMMNTIVVGYHMVHPLSPTGLRRMMPAVDHPYVYVVVVFVVRKGWIDDDDGDVFDDGVA